MRQCVYLFLMTRGIHYISAREWRKKKLFHFRGCANTTHKIESEARRDRALQTLVNKRKVCREICASGSEKTERQQKKKSIEWNEMLTWLNRFSASTQAAVFKASKVALPKPSLTPPRASTAHTLIIFQHTRWLESRLVTTYSPFFLSSSFR